MQLIDSWLPFERADLHRAYAARELLWAKRTRSAEIAETPLFDAAGKECFMRLIASSRIYLEYGSGASTRVAARHVETLVTVESDKHYLRAVARSLPPNARQRRELIHANIGLTEEWGAPVFRKLTGRRRARWASYAAVPWKRLGGWGLEPDLVLVDGRFRVACVLESVRHLRNPSACTILLDDYTPRRFYRAVEIFCDVQRLEGRMAVLRPKAHIDEGELLAELGAARRDFR